MESEWYSVISSRAIRPSMTWSPTCLWGPLQHPLLLGSGPYWSSAPPSKRLHQCHLGALALDVSSGHLPPSHCFCTSCDNPSLTMVTKSTSSSHHITILWPFVSFMALSTFWNSLLMYLSYMFLVGRPSSECEPCKGKVVWLNAVLCLSAKNSSKSPQNLKLPVPQNICSMNSLLWLV